MITNCMLASFCEQALKKKTMYMWGTYGKLITNSLIASKAKQYPKNYSQTRVNKLLKHVDGDTRGCDCGGLIKWAMWTEGDINGKIKYNEPTDRTCSELLAAATEKGPIDTLPEMRGIVVYKKGHVGVYVGKKNVVECTLGSRGDGVVKTKLADGKWTHWLKVPEIMYVSETKEDRLSAYMKKLPLLERLHHIFK